MNDTDQFDAMDEMSDWALANTDVLAAMDRVGRTRTAPDSVTHSTRQVEGGPFEHDPTGGERVGPPPEEGVRGP